MGAFETCRTFQVTVSDLKPVAEAVAEHFRRQDFEVEIDRRITGAYDISLTRGGLFRSVAGLRSALKIELETQGETTWAQASVGIWGAQVVPLLVAKFVFWPVLLTQIWGIVRSSKLDDQAMQVIEESLKRHAVCGRESGARGAAPGQARFCSECGMALPREAAFCAECGHRILAAT